MSRSSTAADRRSAGFTLIEVLVALVAAALLLDVLARAMAASWAASRWPMEQVSALAVARAVAAGGGPQGRDRGPEGRIERFDYLTTIRPLTIDPRPSTLAPAPQRTALARDETDSPAKPAAREPPPRGELHRVTVVVTAPSGRRLTFETIRLESGRN